LSDTSGKKPVALSAEIGKSVDCPFKSAADCPPVYCSVNRFIAKDDGASCALDGIHGVAGLRLVFGMHMLMAIVAGTECPACTG